MSWPERKTWPTPGKLPGVCTPTGPSFEEPPGSDSRGLTEGPPRSAGRIPLAGVKVGRGRLIVSESRAVRWVGRGLPRPLGLSTPAAPAFQPQEKAPAKPPERACWDKVWGSQVSPKRVGGPHQEAHAPAGPGLLPPQPSSSQAFSSFPSQPCSPALYLGPSLGFGETQQPRRRPRGLGWG